MGLAVITAVVLAFMSVRIERIGPELVQYGNLCEPPGLDGCYKPVLKGGFPYAYLFDAPGILRERQLAFFEDRLEVGALVADVAVYVTAIIVAAGSSCATDWTFEIDYGAPDFDVHDINWACDEVWAATPNILEIPVAFSSRPWKTCLSAVTRLVVSAIDEEIAGDVLKSGEGVAVGFVDGDFHLVWQR